MDWDFIKSFNVLTVTGSKNIEGFKDNIKQVKIPNVKVWEFKPLKNTKNNGSSTDCNNCSSYSACLEIFRSKSKCCNEVCREISKNHKIIVKEAYDNNLENVMIFEDDARFTLPFNFEKLNKVMNFIKSNDWDIFYFGHCPAIPIGYPVNKNIVRTLYPGLFHCYLLNRKGMEALLKIENNNYIDLKLGRNQSLLKYAVFPSMSYQSEGPGIYTSMFLNNIISFNSINYILESLQYFIIPIIIIILIIVFIKKKNKILY